MHFTLLDLYNPGGVESIPYGVYLSPRYISNEPLAPELGLLAPGCPQRATPSAFSRTGAGVGAREGKGERGWLQLFNGWIGEHGFQKPERKNQTRLVVGRRSFAGHSPLAN
jgi:hypothetical protein